MKILLLTTFLVMSSVLAAQAPDGGDRHRGEDGPPDAFHARSYGSRYVHAGPGRWWSDPHMVQQLGLTADQQHRMDDLFQARRLKLIDMSAALQKEEVIMEPLLEADRPDEAKILVQIDRIAQARAELEKANARLLLGLRSVLTQDQWKKLQAERAHGPEDGHRGQDRGAGGPPDRPADAPPHPR